MAGANSTQVSAANNAICIWRCLFCFSNVMFMTDGACNHVNDVTVKRERTKGGEGSFAVQIIDESSVPIEIVLFLE